MDQKLKPSEIAPMRLHFSQDMSSSPTLSNKTGVTYCSNVAFGETSVLIELVRLIGKLQLPNIGRSSLLQAGLLTTMA